MAKNIGTLGKYDQRKLWKLICIVNPFIKKCTKIELFIGLYEFKMGRNIIMK